MSAPSTAPPIYLHHPFDLVRHTCFRWHVRPRQVTGDTTYSALEVVRGLEETGIRAYVPLRGDATHGALFGKGQFTYDAEQDCYRCPQGVVLNSVGTSSVDRVTRYQAPAESCNACPCKAQCTTSKTGRAVTRSLDEAYHERVRAYAGTAAYEKALRKRKVWVEPLFAEAKQWHGVRRFRLRDLPKVNGEALLTATGQNLKRLLSRQGWGRRPWPSGAAGLRLPVTQPHDVAWR